MIVTTLEQEKRMNIAKVKLCNKYCTLIPPLYGLTSCKTAILFAAVLQRAGLHKVKPLQRVDSRQFFTLES